MRDEHDRPTKPHKIRIPEFASHEEEAEFWDTHDFTDYLDELKPVKVRVANSLSAHPNLKYQKNQLL